MRNNKDFMDILNMLSFSVSVANLDSNLDQDKADKLLKGAVKDIHKHLKEQDKKLDMIIKTLEEIYNDKN